MAAALSAGASLHAQTASTPALPANPAPAASSAPTPSTAAVTNPADIAEDQAVTLSPFEVTATSDTDTYTAETTLAGNRLSTELRDIGSSVTVVTSQLLLDTGATDNTSLLQRIGGAEVGGVYGNYASPGPDTSSQLLTEDTIHPSEDTRIRGLAAADNTHDFFPSDIPWDEYDTDRIDIQRGPNAILFGEGSPAGIINAGSKGAEFINTGNLDLRYGSWGTTRESLDYNQVIVPDQVAFRIDLLHDDEKFEQQPAYSKDQRIAGALRIEPAFLNKNGNRTIIKAHVEAGQINSDNPRALPPTDHITPWFNPNSGVYQVGLNGLNSWVPLPSPAPTASNGYVSAARPNQMPYFSNGQILNDNFPLAVLQNGSSSGTAGTYGFQYLAQPGEATSTGLTWPYGAFPGSIVSINGEGAEAVFAGLPYSNGGVFTDNSINNPSIFNFYKNLIDGNMKSEWQHFWSGNANLTQTFLDDQVGFSLDYYKQHFEDGQINPLGGAVPLYVDVMSTLNQGPGGAVVTSLSNAAPNPNFGRPFVINHDYGNNDNYISDREVERATAFLTHDFSKDSKAWWDELLGIQTLTGLADQEKQNTNTLNWQQYGYLGSNLSLAESLGGNGAAGDNFAAAAPQQVIYLGPSLYGKQLVGANIPRITGDPTIGSQQVNYFDFTPNPANAALGPTNPAYYNGWTGEQTLQVTDSESDPSVNRDLLATGDAITRSVTTSEALVYEGKWLDDALVGIYGWRRDINKSWADTATLGDANDAQSINFQNIGFSSAPQGRIEVQSRSYSLVAHLGELPGIKDFANRLPVDVSLSYNVSTNFEPDSSRVNIDGDPTAPPSGKTIDRGILLETRDGRFAFKINRYVTSIANGSNPDGTSFAQQLANWFGNTAYYGNVFYYRNNQNAGLPQSDPSQADSNPGIGADGSATGQSGVGNTSYGAGYYFDAAGWHTPAMEALQVSSTEATRAYETQINQDFPNFFKNWGMGTAAAVLAGDDLRGQLQSLPGETNFAITENSKSQGWELELDANPTKNWRITLNATQTDAVVTSIGDPALAKFMSETTAYVQGPGGYQQWYWGNSAGPGNSVPNVGQTYYISYSGSGNPGTYYAELQQQQNVPVSQLAKWRFNATTDYDFDHGFLKGVNIGGGVRFTAAEILGYPPGGNPANPPPYLPDFSHPEMGPSETYFDFWVGYRRKITNKVNWNIQLNIANVGRGDYLIPVSYQAPINGAVQPAFYRIGPNQQITIRNVFSF